MASSTSIIEINGASPGTITNLTSARYSTTDSVTPGLTYPIPIPSAGSFNWSFHKTHGLAIAGSAENYTWTQIDNIKWYTDGTLGWNLGTSGKMYVGTRDVATYGHGVGISGYIRASGTVGTTGIVFSSGYVTYQAQSGITSVVNFVEATPLQVDTIAYATSAITKCIVTQISVDDDATQGTQAAETFTFRYDEI